MSKNMNAIADKWREFLKHHQNRVMTAQSMIEPVGGTPRPIPTSTVLPCLTCGMYVEGSPEMCDDVGRGTNCWSPEGVLRGWDEQEYE